MSIVPELVAVPLSLVSPPLHDPELLIAPPSLKLPAPEPFQVPALLIVPVVLAPELTLPFQVPPRLLLIVPVLEATLAL